MKSIWIHNIGCSDIMYCTSNRTYAEAHKNIWERIILGFQMLRVDRILTRAVWMCCLCCHWLDALNWQPLTWLTFIALTVLSASSVTLRHSSFWPDALLAAHLTSISSHLDKNLLLKLRILDSSRLPIQWSSSFNSQRLLSIPVQRLVCKAVKEWWVSESAIWSLCQQ